jgi:transcriptional regulator with XRE-family HTH domain
MENLARAIGARLRNHRKAAHLTQEETAFRAGLHHTYIGQLERGEKNATIESIGKVTRALGISFDTLFKDLDTVRNTSREQTALQCYHMIEALPPNDQQELYEIISRIIHYKEI